MRMRILFLLSILLNAGWGLSKGVLQLPTDLIISEEFEEVPLEQVFKKMHRRYHIFFSYSKEIVSPYKVNLTIDRLPLRDAMELILKPTDLTYEILEGKFILIKKKIPQANKQPYICGWVVDKGSGDHLPYATLRLVGTKFGTICKKDGSFYFSGDYPKDSLVEISYLGFKKKRISFRQLVNNPCAPISLDREVTTLEGITISEYLTDGISQLGHAITLQPNKIRALPGLTETDLFQLAQYIPGISSSEETAAGIQIRGGNSDQTLVSLDGIPLFQTGHFFDMISSLNPSGISEAKIYRSGYDATQSGRVSGLIQLSQGEEIPEKMEKGISLNLTHAGFHLKTPINKKKTGIFVSGRRSLVNNISSLTFNRLEERVFQSTRIGDQIEESKNDNDDFEFLNTFVFEDWNAKLIHQPNDKHKFSFINHFSRNRLTYLAELISENQGVRDSVFQRNLGFGFHWDYASPKNLNIHTAFTLSDYRSSYGFRYYEVDTDFRFEDIIQTNAISDIRLTHEYSWLFKKRNTFKLGTQITSQSAGYLFTYLDEENREQEEDVFQEAILTSLYGYHKFLGDRWWLESSYRVSYHSLADELFFDPRVSFDYRLTKDLHLKLHAGVYHQFITQLIQWDFEYGWINQPLWAMSNGNEISVVTSYQGTAGFKYDKNGWLLDVEAYYKEIDDITSLNSNFTTSDDEFFVEGEATILGLDVLLKKRWRKVRMWGSYSLSRTNYEFQDFSPEPFPAPQDQRHRLTLTSLLDLNAWHFATSWNFRTGKPYTDVESQEEELVMEENESFYVVSPVFGVPFGERLRDYHRVDVSAFYQFQSKKNPERSLSIGLSILNILNRENDLSRQFFRDFYDENDPVFERNVEQVDKILLERIPNLSVKVRW